MFVRRGRMVVNRRNVQNESKREEGIDEFEETEEEINFKHKIEFLITLLQSSLASSKRRNLFRVSDCPECFLSNSRTKEILFQSMVNSSNEFPPNLSNFSNLSLKQ